MFPCLDLHSPALGTAARLLWPICSPLNKLHGGFREGDMIDHSIQRPQQQYLSADAGRISNNYIFGVVVVGGGDFHRQPSCFRREVLLLNAMRRGCVLVKTVVEEGGGWGGGCVRWG